MWDILCALFRLRRETAHTMPHGTLQLSSMYWWNCCRLLYRCFSFLHDFCIGSLSSAACVIVVWNMHVLRKYLVSSQQQSRFEFYLFSLNYNFIPSYSNQLGVCTIQLNVHSIAQGMNYNLFISSMQLVIGCWQPDTSIHVHFLNAFVISDIVFVCFSHFMVRLCIQFNSVRFYMYSRSQFSSSSIF